MEGFAWRNCTGMRHTDMAERKSSESDTSTNLAIESTAPPRFAVCIDNSEYPASLVAHKIYRVLPDEAAAADGDCRVIDESGEDYLYPTSRFVLLDLPPAVERAILAGSR